MGYEVRSLPSLSAEARGYFVSAVDGASVSIWPNSFTVTAKVLALLGHEHERRRAHLFDQIFPSTAEAAALERHGYEHGLMRQAGAEANGILTVAAPDGLVIPSKLRFVRGDGTSYRSVAAVTAAGGAAELAIEAEEIGAAANAAAGTALTLGAESVAPAGMARDGAVAAGGLVGGADDETVEAFRERLLERRRLPPKAGSETDYVAWAHEALPEVARVFADSFSDDPGAVWVQFTVTDQIDGFPTEEQVASVEAYLRDPLRKPLTARIYVSASQPSEVPVSIEALDPDTPATRAAVEAELRALFADNVEPGRPSKPYRLRRSMIEAAIARVVGDDGFELAEPASGQSFAAGVMPALGPVMFL